jgi:hypothetical protein
MQTLGATEAVSPAIARTKLVLFSPFRAGRTWKLSATGYLAFAATVFLPFPFLYISLAASLMHSGHRTAAELVIVGVIVLTAILLVLFYVFSRLEFVFFDIVLHRGEFVAPAWRKYGEQTWPWIAIKVVLGVAMIAVFSVPLVSYMHHGFGMMFMMKPGQPPPPGFVLQLLGFEFTFFAIFGAMFLIGSLLTDFVLPSMALENAPVRESLRRFVALMRREPGQIAGFVGMKALLAIAGYIAQTILFYVVVLVFMIVMAIIFIVGYLVLHALHVPSVVMVVLAFVAAVPLYFGLIGYVLILLLGVLLTFLQAYALYFLGGRYPLIGKALEASTPAPPGWHAPVAWQVPQGLEYPPR